MAAVNRLAGTLLVCCVLPLSACGGDSESSPSTAADRATTAAPTQTTAPTTTVAPTTTTTATTTPSTTSTTARKPKRVKPKPKPQADSDVEAAQSFYFAMDDLAIELDDAIGQALDGEAADLSSISRRIHQRNDKRLLSSGETSVGGNELASAATEAVEAAAAGETRDLIGVRQDVVTARSDLAGEAVK